jgi:DNA-binding CsgD family transcriptional regulator
LHHLAMVQCFEGDLVGGEAAIEEANAIAAATGDASTTIFLGSFLLAACRGDEARLSGLVEAGEPILIGRGEGVALSHGEHARALLHNGLGHYEAALAPAQSASAQNDLWVSGWALPELVEAAARTADRQRAAVALESLSRRTRATGTQWGLGIEARSRALLSEGTVAEELYREAIDRLGRSRVALELARAHLLYGEWLRRARRRVDARENLRVAHDMLTGMGAHGFAERAHRELLATGATARKRTDETRDELTAQEVQIARLAKDGLSNPEIGAQLFISPRTVKYHLRKVFTKLEISSRGELSAALPEPIRAAAAA